MVDDGHVTAGKVVVPSVYWKVQGLVPVKLKVIFAADPVHIEVVPVIVAVGLAFTVILIGVTALTHPVALITVKSALYVPGATVAGITTGIGDTGSDATISVNPAVSAAPLKSMLY